MKSTVSLNGMLLFALFLLVSACQADIPLEGHVLEHGTDKPISNAIVVARWQESSRGIGHSSSSCVQVQTATTDEQGRFRMPGYQDRTPIMNVYVNGYERILPNESLDNTRLYVKSFTGSRGQRLEYLLHLSGLASCYGSGDEKSAFPFYKALYDEARQITASDKEKQITSKIRRRATLVWIRSERTLTEQEVESLIQRDAYLREQLK